jgi:proline iminopeptidase
MDNGMAESGVVIPILFLTTIFAVQCATPDLEAASSVSDGFIHSSDRVELYYQIRGERPDTLIMLHGGPGLSFDYLAPDLEQLEESFTLIYYDQRGNGRSTLVSESDLLTVDAHLADLEAVRQYFGLNKISLFGHSWGALLASFYALEHSANLDRIVLASPASPRRLPYFQQLTPNIMAWMDSTTVAEVERLRAYRRDTKESCEAFWEVFIRGYFADPRDMETIQKMKGSFCTGSEESLRNGAVAGAHTMASAGNFDLRNQLNEIDVPVLIITGTEDIFPSEAMEEWEAAYPNAQLVLLDGAGHYPQVERPDEFFGAVKVFLME